MRAEIVARRVNDNGNARSMMISMGTTYNDALETWEEANAACEAAWSDLDNCELAVEIARFTLELAEGESELAKHTDIVRTGARRLNTGKGEL